MQNKDRGRKRECPSCEKKFYDFTKPAPFICPWCQSTVNPLTTKKHRPESIDSQIDDSFNADDDDGIDFVDCLDSDDDDEDASVVHVSNTDSDFPDTLKMDDDEDDDSDIFEEDDTPTR